MSYVKEIVVLANSIKNQARCVAGKTLGDKEWVRPVSSAAGGALSDTDTRDEHGQSLALLDVVRVVMRGKSQHAYQVENHLIDDRYHWIKVRKASASDLRKCADSVTGSLWINGFSSYSGSNDRVPEGRAPEVVDTLKLVYVDDLSIHIIDGYGNKKQTRGTFTLSGIYYNLVVTDPEMQIKYAGQANGRYPHGECYLCLSLGEPINGYSYKLIAAVLDAGSAD